MNNCEHTWIVYKGHKHSSGIPNWCPKCGEVKVTTKPEEKK